MPFSLPRWIAHRGGGALAPENTLAGIRLAARMGFRAVEFDVMLSAEGTPVLIHDETLERTTNGHGLVCQTADRELFALDAGNGERIPHFVEAAGLCRDLGLLANVEIKPAVGYERATAETVVRLAADIWRSAPELVLLSSFVPESLVIARDLAPELRRSLLFEVVPADWHSTFLQLRATALHCDFVTLTDVVLVEAAAHGVPVLCYTVDAPSTAVALLARGVSGFFTDRLDLVADQARC
ncbi:MAG: glycerophosphodiester phosphodiesterase [Betaproteobacteria bacterium HGW-Betaproteobacteria-12]|nr:MAG: glycerophosphodiester phosphodiesterase [Betaproteobacteria bacterium HGW-Betaproteobacteria-12]